MIQQICSTSQNIYKNFRDNKSRTLLVNWWIFKLHHINIIVTSHNKFKPLFANNGIPYCDGSSGSSGSNQKSKQFLRRFNVSLRRVTPAILDLKKTSNCGICSTSIIFVININLFTIAVILANVTGLAHD